MRIDVEGSTIAISLGIIGTMVGVWLIIEAASLIIRKVSMSHSIFLYMAICRKAKKQAPVGWKYSANLSDFVSIDGRFRDIVPSTTYPIFGKGYVAYITMRSEIDPKKYTRTESRIDWKGKADMRTMISTCENANKAIDQAALKMAARERRLDELGI
jgi:hypothetical protein